MGCVTLVGSPLLIKSVWVRWQKLWWISPLLFVTGILSLVVSWHPALRVQVWDSEIHAMTDSFQPELAIAGWLTAMFAATYCPMVGLRGDRRWA
jgi:hypothetical protein